MCEYQRCDILWVLRMDYQIYVDIDENCIVFLQGEKLDRKILRREGPSLCAAYSLETGMGGLSGITYS